MSGETARRYLLDSQVGGHFDERKVGKVAPLIAKHARYLSDAIFSREAKCRGCRGERFLLAFLRMRHAAAYALRELCDRLAGYCTIASTSPDRALCACVSTLNSKLQIFNPKP